MLTSPYLLTTATYFGDDRYMELAWRWQLHRLFQGWHLLRYPEPWGCNQGWDSFESKMVSPKQNVLCTNLDPTKKVSKYTKIRSINAVTHVSKNETLENWRQHTGVQDAVETDQRFKGQKVKQAQLEQPHDWRRLFTSFAYLPVESGKLCPVYSIYPFL